MIDDVFINRIFLKFDKLEETISGDDGLCERITRMEEKLNAHFDDLKSKAQNKERKFYIIIAIIGVLFTVRELI